MKIDLYIYDKVEAIKTGQCQTVVYSKDGVQYAAYSGDSYTGKDLTLDQYLSKKNNPNLVVSTWEEFDQNIHSPYLKRLQGEFEKITKERWEDNLCCLPPKKWHDVEKGINVFYVGECYTDNLYRMCVKLTNGKKVKCYSALRPINLTDEQIKQQLKEQGII